jgi:SpoVK/Ycf46/Vps4 family AAA+-type ATPase
VEIKLTHSQLKSVQEYCKLNNIEDVDKFITKCYTEGFNIKKYGLLGDDSGKTDIVSEKQVEIEVIREIRVEVPVEVIKEIEVIKEVIVEVPVPNIDKIGDETQVNDKVKLLQETLQKLRKELSLKNARIEELEKINKQNNI